LTGALVIGALLAVLLVPLAAGFITTYALLYVPCSGASSTPSDYGYGWEDATLAARSGSQSIRGYFIPGTNGATVIITPTMSGSRASRLHIANILSKHGYAVLTFDSRRCADMGPLTLGYKEADDVGSTLDYLRVRGDVNAERIGILGFSSAGAAAVMAAARFPEIHAVVAEGGYGDFAENVIGLDNGQGSLLERLYKWSLGASYHLITGVDIHKLSPTTAVTQIRPRPILLIYGSLERSLEGARQQQAAAGENAELWVVEGARHGQYLSVAPEEYEAHLIAFFDRSLPGEPE
jgi:dienelactone hydrolase